MLFVNMIILTWNVMGLGDQIKRAGVKDFCIYKIDVMCFQESNLVSLSDSFLRSLGYSQIIE